MAFDPKVHVIDSSGFMVDKETGHKVGLENKPRVAVAGEWPKWVTKDLSAVSEEQKSEDGSGEVDPVA